MELFKVDFGLTIWMFVAFAILFFILWKFAWPYIMKGIDGRADLIDKGVEYAQSAKEKLDNANAEAGTQIIESAREDARKEAQKEKDAAKLSIEQSRREAEQSLRDQVSDMAIEIAGKVTRNQLKSDDAQKKLVNTYLDEIESKN